MALKSNRTQGVGTAIQFKLIIGQPEENLSDAGNAVIKPTPDAKIIDMRSHSRFAHTISGQSLAGSGALVFEGELLDGLHRGMH